MQNEIILETERLYLRHFKLADAEFILKLLNTPNWIKFIGNKNVSTIEEAENYIKKLVIGYTKNTMGLSLVSLKKGNIPLGMCGLVKRDILEHFDIGFALLPEYSKLGYAYEISSATMNYAKNTLKIEKIVAITDSTNIDSIKLLNKLGLNFEKTLELSEDNVVSLFS